jgi:hypothetical protein
MRRLPVYAPSGEPTKAFAVSAIGTHLLFAANHELLPPCGYHFVLRRTSIAEPEVLNVPGELRVWLSSRTEIMDEFAFMHESKDCLTIRVGTLRQHRELILEVTSRWRCDLSHRRE